MGNNIPLNKTVPTNSRFYQSLIVPGLMALLMWAVFLWEIYFDFSLNSYGLYPRDIMGLRGIILAPFLHGDFEHLINNTYPVLILGTAIYYFYAKSANYVVAYSFLMTGIWVWAIARPSFHIGASGLIYAWGTFLFFSGAITKNKRMMGLSLLVVFLYGSLVWGVLPIMPGVSWESHLLGAISGIILAWYFRAEAPQRRKFQWEDNEEEYEIEFWNMTQNEINEYYRNKQAQKTSEENSTEVRYKYIFKPKSSD